MKPDDKTERLNPVEDHDESPNIEREHEPEAAEVQEAQPTGWAAQLRQLMHRSAQGEARTNIKRQQLREDRTKSFLLLAGLTVVLALAFFVMFSTPSTGRKDIARTNQPNLGRGSGGENTDTSHSVTPLLNADTRNPDDNAGNLSAQDIRNTAKQRMLAQASPSFGDAPVPPPPAPRPEPKDYALNRIQFPPEQPQTTTPIPAPKVDKLTKASLVFVSSGSGPRVTAQTSSSVQPVVLERNPEFMALPTGTRLIARLQTPVSSAVKTPVVAAIEYNYERDGEIVIPAGSKAFGELSQVNDQGYVGTYCGFLYLLKWDPFWGWTLSFGLENRNKAEGFLILISTLFWIIATLRILLRGFRITDLRPVALENPNPRQEKARRRFTLTDLILFYHFFNRK
jgi:hypothetical protein